jgi:hypothetical protein
MARYRIVKRGGTVNPTKAHYDVEERVLCFWFWQNTFSTLEGAETLVRDLLTKEKRIKREVVGEYD